MEKIKDSELIKLSAEKGFVSRDHLVEVYESYYYLWMCELQRWLREKHNAFVQVEIDMTMEPKYCYSLFVYKPFYKDEPFYVYPLKRQYSDLYRTYEEALEDGLSEALKLDY